MSDPKPTPEETAMWQRRLASQANNRAWQLAEQPSRTAAEDEEMLQAAHAAAFFWNIVGKASNQAHAAQLLAHVYAYLGLARPARHYLDRSFGYFTDPATASARWELAFAYAISAHVAAREGDAATHRAHHAQAQGLIAALEDPEDRAILETTFRTLPVPMPVSTQA